MKAEEWVRIPWDGNPELKLECWRQKFGAGHVSVGIGGFLNIVYSYGSNHGDSMSATRWRESGPISEEDAMRLVDKAKGKHNACYT